jgi:hypothetical protein
MKEQSNHYLNTASAVVEHECFIRRGRRGVAADLAAEQALVMQEFLRKKLGC